MITRTRLSLGLLAPSLLVAAAFAACGDDAGGGQGGSKTTTTTTGSTPSTTSTESGPTTGPGGGNTTATTTTTATTASGETTTATSTGSACNPDCTGRDCGTDSCGGSCGTCDGTNVCNSAGLCVAPPPEGFSFFVSSVGNLSGDFGGLAGADTFCQNLATAVGAGDRQWRAYLSVTGTNARDRIGTGPWYDASGAMVAASVAALHADGIVNEHMLDETGAAVPNGKTHPGSNEHDILTGSTQEGMATGADCNGWTSSEPFAYNATVGHCDASFTQSGGTSPIEPSDNWNSVHASHGCSAESLGNTAGTGRIYCFAL